MTTPAPPDEPQRPKLQCPVRVCDKWWYFPVSGNIADIEEELELHTESHTGKEFMDTISFLQSELIDAHRRIEELESAVRGAALMMGGPPGGSDSGLILPESVQKKLEVPGEGEVKMIGGKPAQKVGQRITDKSVLKQLGIDRRGRRRG